MTQIRNLEKHRQQLRGFVAVWLSVTLLIGVATFVGIYVGTGQLKASAENDNSVQVVPIAQDESNTNDVAAASINVDNTASENADTVVDEESSANTTAFNITTDQTDQSNSAANITESVESDDANTVIQEAAGSPDNNPPAQDDPTPVPQPTIPPVQDRDFNLGIQVIPNFNNDRGIIEGDLDAAANQLNLNWVKLQVRWEFAEPSPGVYEWEQQGYDVFFEVAQEKNLKVLISVVSSPEWAREPGANLSQHGPPADFQVFANFVGNMISRYPGQIHAVEVWNEMNLAREWTSTGGLSAANYVQMATTVANTVRFLDPNIIVVSGALSPTGVDDGVIAIDDFRYTDQLIAAGLLNVVDCFGAHHNGYNIGPNVPFDNVPNDPNAIFRGPFNNPHHSWSFYSTLTTYANKIRAAGSEVPLCVTEFGWAVAEDLNPDLRPIPNFEFSEDNTLEEQRMFFVEAVRLMEEEWDFVWLAFIWNLNFGKEANWDISRPDRDNIPYSLVRPNYIPAEAWAYIADMDFRGRDSE